MKKNIYLILLILLSFNGRAQLLNTKNYDVLLLDNTQNIDSITSIYFDSSLSLPINKIPVQQFTPLLSFQKRESVPINMVTKPVYIKFTLHNSGNNPTSFYFYPGSLYSELKVYTFQENQLITEDESDSSEYGYIHMFLGPQQEKTFIIKGLFCRNIKNDIQSQIISSQFFPFYKMETDKTLISKRVIGILLSGALCMMVIFTLVNFILNGKREFLYNCIYSLCMFFLIFFTSSLSKDTGWFKSFFIGYLDLILLTVGTFFYFSFTRKFLNTKIEYPKLDKFIAIEQWLLMILLIVFSVFHYLPDTYIWENRIENIIKMITLIASLVYVIVSLFKKNRLMNYLAIGVAFQIFFYIISFIFIHADVDTNHIFTAPIFYFELGVIVAMFFFLLGLSYKNRMEIIGKIKEQEAMKLEIETKKFETKIAVLNAQQEERNRISADMHDDLGAGMTSIRLNSELAKRKLGNQQIPEIEKISHSASELLDKMNAIIWSMSSSNDSFGNMIAYIRSYAIEYLEEHNLIVNIFLPENFPDVVVAGKVRRNMFLVVKEALHNIVKHADATIVDLTMKQEGSVFYLIIHDNGKGIDTDNIRTFGNGLKNMKKRMDDVGINFTIKNDNGTTILFSKNAEALLRSEDGEK